MDLCSLDPKFNLYDVDWPIHSLWHADPPAKTVLDDGSRRAEVVDSLISAGVVVSGGKVRRSILSNRVRVEEQAVVEDSILFGGVIVRPGARVRRAIVDKWTEVPPGARIGYDRAEDEKRFTVTPSGIVVVPMRYAFEGSAPAREGHNGNFPRPGE
jgi:glucose-1-phosphate adenylyltransferase